jgi:rod shape determining protein RodA
VQTAFLSLGFLPFGKSFMLEKMTFRFRDFDWFIFLLAIAIAAVGVIEIYSASQGSHHERYYLKQIYWILFGLLGMAIVVRIDYHTLAESVPYFYICAIAALVLVLLVGHKVSGTRGWISLGGFNLGQPAELVKVVVILALARFLGEIRTEYLTTPDILKASAIVGLPVFLILLQPDLGSALTFLPILGMGLFLGGLRVKWILATVILSLLMIGGGWFALKPYQKERIYTFLDPHRDPLGRGYHSIQSKIAVGSGGVWGKGLTKGSQSALGFLPESPTDFIFSVIGEELGFVGSTVLLLFYFLLTARCIHVGQTARDKLGIYIVLCASSVLIFHILVNVGMVVGIMPITGIPLPLLSYGGSAILATFLLLGLIINVCMRRYVY